MLLRVWRLVVAVCVVSPAGGVLAHAGPQVRGIQLAHERAPNLLLSNRGLFFGPAQDSWQLMCNEALGIPTAELPEVVQFGDRRLLAASSSGLQESLDEGCGWQAVAPFGEVNATGLVLDASEPQRLYLTTFGPGQSGLRFSSDAGVTWQLLAAAGDAEFLRDVRVAPGRPEQLYVRGLVFGSGAFQYSTWCSRDRGQTWQKNPIEIPKGESDFRLLAVSPANPDLIVAKAEASNPMQTPERLLVSRDAGVSYQSPINLHVLNAAAFSADGKVLWVGSDDGLFVSRDDAVSFTRVGASAYVDSLLVADAKLYLGGYYLGVSAGKVGVGVSSDGGETFETWMDLTQVRSPVPCAASTKTGMLCEALWTDWEREILSPAAAGSSGTPAATGGAGSAGAPGAAGSGAAGTPTAPPPSSGGCRVAASNDRWGAWWALSAAGWLLCRRSRRVKLRAPTRAGIWPR